MRTKKDFQEQLLKDEFYSNVISMADDQTKEHIKNIVETFFIDAMTIVEEFSESIKNNPNAASELLQAIKDDAGLINDTGKKEKLNAK